MLLPKNIFVGRNTLEYGVYSAIFDYNGGPNAILDVFGYFGIIGQRT